MLASTLFAASLLAASAAPDPGRARFARMFEPGIAVPNPVAPGPAAPSPPTVRRPTPPTPPLGPGRMREAERKKKAQRKSPAGSFLKSGRTGFPLLDLMFAKPGAAKKAKP